MPEREPQGRGERRWKISGYSCQPFVSGKVEVVEASAHDSLARELEAKTEALRAARAVCSDLVRVADMHDTLLEMPCGDPIIEEARGVLRGPK